MSLYSGIKDWHNQTSWDIKNKTYVHYFHTFSDKIHPKEVFSTKTLYGRKRLWPDWDRESTAILTEACNSKVQGTAADITKLALSALYKVLPEEAHIVMCIHDEIVVECPEGIAEKVKDLMIRVMCEEGEKVCYPVKIDAEGEIGQSWGG